jgi:hypothetical protein
VPHVTSLLALVELYPYYRQAVKTFRAVFIEFAENFDNKNPRAENKINKNLTKSALAIDKGIVNEYSLNIVTI